MRVMTFSKVRLESAAKVALQETFFMENPRKQSIPEVTADRYSSLGILLSIRIPNDPRDKKHYK